MANVTSRIHERIHLPRQRWIEQSDHVEEKLLTQILLGGSSDVKGCRESPGTLTLVPTSPCNKGSESVKMKRRKSTFCLRGKMQTQAFFFFFFLWGGGFGSSLVEEESVKGNKK